MMISLPAKLLDATADLLALALVFDLAEPAGPLQLLSPHSFHHSENDFLCHQVIGEHRDDLR